MVTTDIKFISELRRVFSTLSLCLETFKIPLQMGREAATPPHALPEAYTGSHSAKSCLA